MQIGILGTGMVGAALGTKLIELGHLVEMGSRTAGNDAAAAWVAAAGARASHGTFADAARFGEIVIACLRGDVALAAIRDAGTENLRGKIVIDVSNPLDQTGPPPWPLLADLVNTRSLGEEVQRLLPESFVVKTLNTVNCGVMVDPGGLGAETDLFISGNDASAKRKVSELLRSFGWTDPIDLGDIATARGTEMMMPIWMRLWAVLGTPLFNFKVVKGRPAR